MAMARFLKAALPALLFFVLAVPAHAANLPILSPGIAIVPDAHAIDASCPEGAPLSTGAVLQLIQNLMNAGISIGVIALVAVLAYVGVLFILSPTNPEAKSKARSILLNAVLGFLIVLAGWLFVDFVMKLIYNPSATFNGEAIGPWNDILQANESPCIQAVAITPIAGLPGINGIDSAVNSIAIGGAASGGGATSGVPVTGDCSAAALAQDWGSEQKGQLFACIVNNESKCQNIPTKAPSVVQGVGSSAGGRYQILMSTNGLNFPSCTAAAQRAGFQVSGNLNCTQHFPRGYSDGSTGAAACRAAQADPTCNTDAAKYLYANGGVSHWLGKGDIGGKNQACVNQYGR